MKNKFLLLSATAILSMGTFTVNATDGLTLEINPKVTMVSPISAKNTDINFGKIAWNGDTSITIGNDGKVTGDAVYYGGATAGYITISGRADPENYDLVMPTSDITLSNKQGETSITCGTASLSVISQTVNPVAYSIYYGGTFTVAGAENMPPLWDGTEGMQCIGEEEITVVIKSN